MTLQGLDDEALLAAHAQGDPDAFGVLFTRHRDRLWAVALRTTGDREEAADALQDALVSAFRQAASYRGEAAVTTWLHRIVVNACLDRLRRRRVRRADPLPDDLEEHAARGDLLAARTADADPEAVAIVSEERTRVLAALRALPPEQRAALVLVDMEAYPVSEAAQILGVPEGTVKSRCSRGRSRLAALLTAPLTPPLTRPGTRDPAGASHPSRDPGPGGNPGPRPGPSPSPSLDHSPSPSPNPSADGGEHA